MYSGGFNDKNDYNFDGFDDIEGSGKSDKRSPVQDKYSNAMKQLDEFDNDQRDGFKVEVKRPQSGKNKANPNSSGKKNRKNFGTKFGSNANEYGRETGDNDDDIEEDIQTEREKESVGNYDNKIESSLGYQGGITVS